MGLIRLYRAKATVVEAEGPLETGRDIQTVAGTMHVRAGDYIVTHADGGLFPCDARSFAATYAPLRHE
jgi:hypothetical protein